jgi:hypothetical protein
MIERNERDKGGMEREERNDQTKQEERERVD